MVTFKEVGKKEYLHVYLSLFSFVMSFTLSMVTNAWTEESSAKNQIW